MLSILYSTVTGCECTCRGSMGLCDGVSTGAEGRVGGQMAFTDLGKKLSVSWLLVVFMNHCDSPC